MPRRFHIRTYGCQMNVHDSDKLTNLLLHAGWAQAESDGSCELLVINTCSIREKAENKLYSDLGVLREWKDEVPGRALGVGGCVAQQEGDAILRRFGHLDFVFGTHNLRWVPEMAEAAFEGMRGARTETNASQERFDLPERHPEFRASTPGRAFLTVMEGCDMFCSFCIVPTTRGREISRPAQGILDEAAALADAGVRQLTLLGQTVNAYGRHDQRRDQTAEAGTMGFAALVRRLAEIPGIERIRYTSPHPLFFDEALVRAHAEVPELCPHVHLPLQSGSDRMLDAMRRRYTAEEYMRWAEALKAARPGLVLTTDVIVGFPGETEADFQATLALVEALAFVDAYTFKYSPRPGTPAAQLTEGSVAADVAQDRLERLQDLLRRLTLDAHRARVGETTEILVEGPSRRATERPDQPVQIRGRDPQHRLVNAEHSAPGGSLVRVEIVDATPHSLIGRPVPAEGVTLTRGERIADEKGRLSAPS
ncbi:MAG: tRNA (N6-isopentenyl adenosine(37)-C2)-methylthiotransferase MiaB [bacterium]|nr:tRNA (N6-isopentenyl adenosine(37)-C2)-methylthiotransferase MiaB [bacterium]